MYKASVKQTHQDSLQPLQEALLLLCSLVLTVTVRGNQTLDSCSCDRLPPFLLLLWAISELVTDNIY